MTSAERSAPISRRALVAGLATGVAAGIAGSLGRALPVRAGVDGDVVLGAQNTTNTATTITNNMDLSQFAGPAIEGKITYLFGGNAVQGICASQVASGVYGENSSGGWGVAGRSNAAGGKGVFGDSNSGTGVLGNSTSGDGVHGDSTNRNGVSGNGQATGVSGVYGENYAGGGYGVAGYAPSIQGIGVRGFTEYGTGVHAYAWAGLALLAEAGHPTANALRVQGRASFSTSGLSSVAVGKTSKIIGAGSDLAAGSRILCTLESNQAGLAIQRVTKNTTTDQFTVFLNKAVAAGKIAKIAWFVFG